MIETLIALPFGSAAVSYIVTELGQLAFRRIREWNYQRKMRRDTTPDVKQLNSELAAMRAELENMKGSN